MYLIVDWMMLWRLDYGFVELNSVIEEWWGSECSQTIDKWMDVLGVIYRIWK